MSAESTSDTSFSRRRRWAIGFNVAISIMSVLALVAMVNYLASRHHHRFHWTSDERFQLSPLTLQLLKSVTNDVQVIVFFDKDELFFSPVTGLLREYSEINPRIKVKAVDYVRYPDEALIVKARYKLTAAANKDMVIFECDTRTKIVHQGELSEYDFKIEELMAGKNEIKRKGFKGELLFSSAILAVTDAKPVKAYFVKNHGEHQIEETGEYGYSKFGDVLKDANITVEILVLRGPNPIPADCQLLIIASPRAGFHHDEIEKLGNYLDQGGRLLATFSYLGATNRTGLEALLAKWGVEVGANVVMDPQNTLSGGDLFATQLTDHAIMRPLINEDNPLHLLLPRTIRPIDGKGADAATATELVSSSPTAFTIADIRDGKPNPGPKDPQGSVPLIVAVEKGQIKGLDAGRGATRLVVAGDSVFLANKLIDDLANRSFAWYAVNWLLDRSVLYGDIGPRPLEQYQIKLSKAQLQSVRWIIMGAIPGAILFLGFLVWMRRRT